MSSSGELEGPKPVTAQTSGTIATVMKIEPKIRWKRYLITLVGVLVSLAAIAVPFYIWRCRIFGACPELVTNFPLKAASKYVFSVREKYCHQANGANMTELVCSNVTTLLSLSMLSSTLESSVFAVHLHSVNADGSEVLAPSEADGGPSNCTDSNSNSFNCSLLFDITMRACVSSDLTQLISLGGPSSLFVDGNSSSGVVEHAFRLLSVIWPELRTSKYGPQAVVANNQIAAATAEFASTAATPVGELPAFYQILDNSEVSITLKTSYNALIPLPQSANGDTVELPYALTRTAVVNKDTGLESVSVMSSVAASAALGADSSTAEPASPDLEVVSPAQYSTMTVSRVGLPQPVDVVQLANKIQAADFADYPLLSVKQRLASPVPAIDAGISEAVPQAPPEVESRNFTLDDVLSNSDSNPTSPSSSDSRVRMLWSSRYPTSPLRTETLSKSIASFSLFGKSVKLNANGVITYRAQPASVDASLTLVLDWGGGSKKLKSWRKSATGIQVIKEQTFTKKDTLWDITINTPFLIPLRLTVGLAIEATTFPGIELQALGALIKSHASIALTGQVGISLPLVGEAGAYAKGNLISTSFPFQVQLQLRGAQGWSCASWSITGNLLGLEAGAYARWIKVTFPKCKWYKPWKCVPRFGLGDPKYFSLWHTNGFPVNAKWIDRCSRDW